MFQQSVPLGPLLAAVVVVAGVALPVVAQARATRSSREAQRQLDSFELGLRVAAARAATPSRLASR